MIEFREVSDKSLPKDVEFLTQEFPRLWEWFNPGYLGWCLEESNRGAVGRSGVLEGKTVCCAIAFLHPWSSEGIYDLAVAAVGEDYRQRGIGRRLISELHNALYLLGGNTVLLNTNTDPQGMSSGKTAEEFWEKMGYREVGILPGYFTGNWDSGKFGRLMAFQLETPDPNSK